MGIHIVIPIINMDLNEIKEMLMERTKDPVTQRKLVLVIVSIALLLDNMLYMVIVPIIPDYLRQQGMWMTHIEGGEVVTEAPLSYSNSSGSYDVPSNITTKIINGITVYEGEDTAIGLLFASKALVQLCINPFSGAIIDRIGYETPMMVGLTIMFFSTAVFACGKSYGLLFFARSLQGVGSAFADTSGLAMIADRFNEEHERTRALGIALAFISFGCLVAPPFGSFLYQFCGKEFPFIVLSLVCLVDGCMLKLVMRPKGFNRVQGDDFEPRPHQKGTPIWKLLMDPYIACCSGALVMANVSLAFLEPTISVWMMDTMPHIEQWQLGMIWLPAFIPHVFGVVITVRFAESCPQYQWLFAAVGLGLEGLCCFIVPFCTSYWGLMIPISGICFGIALIDTALLPTLGYLVDVRHVSVYGSIYAIADISYSLAYAFGPLIAGGVVESIGFTALNIGIAISNLVYCPALLMLRHVYDYKPMAGATSIMMSDPPDKSYQAFKMQDEEINNSRITYQETNIDNPPAYNTVLNGPERDPQFQEYNGGTNNSARTETNPFRQSYNQY
ncbi:vesicular acetylcholine transporter-like [Artemia franciscana]|uniref:Major facilitator superfamily (MFS) profile domain-containing protein n=1 Tax=Artemia franciscana TaxID=6661 RepID=A0AA88I6N7_ARTSF|nr:hypothetical protein QYM36_004668 [Artemia franciscana]